MRVLPLIAAAGIACSVFAVMRVGPTNVVAVYVGPNSIDAGQYDSIIVDSVDFHIPIQEVGSAGIAGDAP